MPLSLRRRRSVYTFFTVRQPLTHLPLDPSITFQPHPTRQRPTTPKHLILYWIRLLSSNNLMLRPSFGFSITCRAHISSELYVALYYVHLLNIVTGILLRRSWNANRGASTWSSWLGSSAIQNLKRSRKNMSRACMFTSTGRVHGANARRATSALNIVTSQRIKWQWFIFSESLSHRSIIIRMFFVHLNIVVRNIMFRY